MNSTIDLTEFEPRTHTLLTALLEAWNHGNVAALDEAMAPSYVRYGRSSQHSLTDLKNSVLDMRRAFPDLHMSVERVVEGKAETAIYWTSVGTLGGEYLGLPPTRRSYSVSGVSFARFDGEKVVSEHVVYDRRGKYSSLGIPLSGAEQSVDDEVGSEALRAMHRTMVTGVTVVTAFDGDEPRGLAVNAFSSVSLEPPLILICVQKNSSTYRHLLSSQYFGVNVLSATQVGVARVFASKQDKKFDLVDWHRGELGAPLLDGATSSMEVELQDTLHASTHTIFIGRVRRVAGTGTPPLIYTNGEFFDGSVLSPADEYVA